GHAAVGTDSVSTPSKVGAASMRGLFRNLPPGMSFHFRRVARIEVWSYGTPVTLRKTVPGCTYDDTMMAGTRMPNMSNLKPFLPTGPGFGGFAPLFGGM